MFTDTVRALASDAEMLSSVPGRKLGGTTLAAWDVHCPYDGSLKKAEHYFGFLPFFHKSKNPLQIFFWLADMSTSVGLWWKWSGLKQRTPARILYQWWHLGNNILLALLEILQSMSAYQSHLCKLLPPKYFSIFENCSRFLEIPSLRIVVFDSGIVKWDKTW